KSVQMEPQENGSSTREDGNDKVTENINGVDSPGSMNSGEAVEEEEIHESDEYSAHHSPDIQKSEDSPSEICSNGISSDKVRSEDEVEPSITKIIQNSSEIAVSKDIDKGENETVEVNADSEIPNIVKGDEEINHALKNKSENVTPTQDDSVNVHICETVDQNIAPEIESSEVMGDGAPSTSATSVRKITGDQEETHETSRSKSSNGLTTEKEKETSERDVKENGIATKVDHVDKDGSESTERSEPSNGKPMKNAPKKPLRRRRSSLANMKDLTIAIPPI
ncbi:5169_t:CDS:1, partial [Acaulospora morrowiae]